MSIFQPELIISLFSFLLNNDSVTDVKECEGSSVWGKRSTIEIQPHLNNQWENFDPINSITQTSVCCIDAGEDGDEADPDPGGPGGEDEQAGPPDGQLGRLTHFNNKGSNE